MKTYTFVIPVKPKPKERPYRARNGRYQTPDATKAYEKQVGYFTREACPDIEPTTNICHLDVKHCKDEDGEQYVIVTIIQTDDAPKPYGGGDGDNILKSIADGLQGIAFSDDKNIKWWSYSREF
jgi:Holliday junction resolvase RusA-like endonuclease